MITAAQQDEYVKKGLRFDIGRALDDLRVLSSMTYFYNIPNRLSKIRDVLNRVESIYTELQAMESK